MQGITKYRITKRQCAESIRGVCSRCGGELEPIETVDNGGNPTYWSGCVSCSCFDSGVSRLVYTIARAMVDDGYCPHSCDHVGPRDSPEMALYKKRQQIGGACVTVRDVLRICGNLTEEEQEGPCLLR